ncbi:MAG: cytochrome c3 family protein [Chloroflexi bacterium]|nr:cytochrome c3 family protein [Chloroflexota bacterium]
MMPKRQRLRTMLGIAGILCLLMGVFVSLTFAQDAAPEATAEQTADSASSSAPVAPEATPETGEAEVDESSDAYCLLCHTKPDQVWNLPGGESLSVTIDPSILAGSVHGAASSEGPLACAECHPNFRYPHPLSLSQTVRDFQVERYAICRDCHEEQYTRAQDSVHGAFLRAGHLEAATCVDCHGGHDIQTPDEPRQRISLTCGNCHGVIFETYRTSIHGSALMGENNADVPTCIDCHGVHDIGDPTSASFRVSSPELCATCHADAELMDKYDINTHVFDSYLTEFHGTTVALFNAEEPERATNKAVCFDCHGVHNIQAVDSEAGTSSIRENLLTTCRQCHPDAGADFDSAWIGHYPATADTHPVFFTVNRLYDVLIPAAFGLVAIVMGTDLFRRVRRWLSPRKRSD